MSALDAEARGIVHGDPRSAVIAGIEPEARALRVRWADGEESRFHHIWLRDNCGCPACKDPHSHQKLVALATIPRDISPAAARVGEDGSLEITWTGDGHRSAFPAAWLRAHSYDGKARRARRYRAPAWDAALHNRLPEIGYEELVASGEAGDLRLLEMVRDHGFALVRETPTDVATTEAVAARIGHVKTTHFGTLSDIVSTPGARNIAYTSSWIAPHTDNAFDHSPPAPAIFHCVAAEQAEGGLTLLADGFRLAEALRLEQPQAFDLLSRVWLQQYAMDDGTELRAEGPVFTLDAQGDVVGVRYCECTQAPLDVDEDLVEPVYDALRLMAEFAVDPRFVITFRLSAGDLLIYDNERVLHGRTAFGAGGGHRHLRAAYLDRETFHSRLRVLARKFGRPDADLVLPRGVGL